MSSKSLEEIQFSFGKAYAKSHEAYLLYKEEQASNKKFMRGKRWTKAQSAVIEKRTPSEISPGA